MSAVGGVAVADDAWARSSDSYTLQDLQGGEDGALEEGKEMIGGRWSWIILKKGTWYL